MAKDAAVCEAFAREGWCDREAGTCPELHIWECPEWHAKGTCARGARCGLRHVLRAEKERVPVAAGVGGFEDQSDFIGLPGEVFSDSEGDEEDGDEGEDEDEEDEEDDEEDGDETHSQGKMDTDDDEDEARVLGEV